MVTRKPNHSIRSNGFLLVDIMLAISILVVVMIPVTYSFAQSQRLARATYHRAVAMEIVDGEMEILKAGGWKDYPAGRQDYTVHAASAQTLPPGRFILVVTPESLRLEWNPEKSGLYEPIVRESRR